MTKEQQTLAARAAKLRKQLADAQAVVDDLKSKLARVEGKLAGEPAPECGLDHLWKAAPEMARTRSSRHKCRVAWNRIPPRERPRISDLLAALAAWKRCQEWRKDGGQFVPALDRWLRDRRWEDLPEDGRPDPSARYRNPLPPPPPPRTPEDEAALREFLNVKPARMRS